MAFVSAGGVGASRQNRAAGSWSGVQGAWAAAAPAAPVRARQNRRAAQIQMAKEAWVQLLPTSDISPGELKPVFAAGQSVVVACDYDGQVYASANICPHLGTPLDNGSVGDGNIVCAQHKSSWNLSTGELAGDWCPFPPLIGPLLGKLVTPSPLNVFSVRENDGFIEALLDIDLKSDYESNYWVGLLDARGKASGEYF
ncbi:Methanesulfonate monooxygenase ferredoxin subunit [Porphyridium purpureum]|uniref:Methanesulfonate monooxygenase ferredoxin subunit n=1 Tax=Porphyridium purpureum TaxID=35688 RepID=A0A5J4YIW4_PORPP|nr:Methanesulfonate monooxygenase ferredoxin subunit [Porphyridium purpureum]8JNG_A Chain A, Methanesulfonate monooxygenase ferredoxin subunit [Porphyridium purpureum]|eukprot:POR3765..scf210_14